MVRATAKQPLAQDDDKKEPRKKKSSGKSKKVSEAGVWPCKINGCNKQFAREADLKRHQRTTKSHSMPGFSGSACPQCDATFTRTDALRRHQKSRHNGVIIEPVETSKGQEDGDEAGSSASKDGSRSTSPSTKAKGKGKTKKHDPDAPTALANPGTAGPASGPSSYYRQHTMQNGVIMDTTQQYAQNGGASAARLHQASWPPPPPWAAEGSQAQMGTISYHPSQPGYYQPSPYYRQNGPPMSGVPVMQPTFASQPQDMHQAPTAAQVAQHTPGADMGNDEDAQGDVEMVDDPNVQDAQPGPIAPVIDPSLDMSVSTVSAQGGNGNVAGGNLHAGQALTPGGSSTKPVSLEITQAAMEAVLQSSRTSGTPDRGAHSTSSSANGHLGAPSTMGGGLGGDETQAPRTITTAKSPFAHQSPVVQAQVLPHTQTMPAAPQSQSQSQVHGLAAPSAVQPELMESILNAAGEPMLTPELLTQHDSLASPP